MSNSDHGCNGNVNNTFSVFDSPGPRQNLILEKKELAATIREYKVFCPQIAVSCKPGQFVVVRQDETGERVPLTIADFDRDAGSITMVVQIVGVSSKRLDVLDVGDRIRDIVGPLGHASEIEKFGSVVCIGGGLGIAPVYPIQRALKDAGNEVISIIGSRDAGMLFWEERMRSCSDDLFVVTNDGSAGEPGFVTGVLQRMIDAGEKIDRVIAVGPPAMMRAVADTTREKKIKTIVSLNSIMVDGTGMCGGCRVEVGGETKFTCVDGPEFDAHEVNFEVLFSRLSSYEREEYRAQHTLAEKQREAEGPVAASERVPMPEQDPVVRVRNFDEVALGYNSSMARAEALRCLQCRKPLCVEGCPVNVDIPGFIREIADGHFLAAARVLKRQNALPAVCGRVCPQESQCEARCVLGKKSSPIAIGRLERFAADTEAKLGEPSTPLRVEATGKKVAIVGGGPAGLTCAADLARMGHKVTLFEALHAPGGVLIYGIPEFRLPKAIVQRECEALRDLGVDMRMNTPIGNAITVPQMFESGFDAVFLGTGAGLPSLLGIPGENLKGVYYSNEFLTRMNLMKAYRFPEYDTPIHIGRKVAVCGGGNVAMDAARSALRLGAETVYIVYRRTQQEMPARKEEVGHALEEGVIFRELTRPDEVIGDDSGWMCGLRCSLMELGEPDDSGRRRPVSISGSSFVLDVDQLIVAIGQGPNPILTQYWPELTVNKRGNIPVDENRMTNLDGVFAGGDIVSGAATVILAMGAGKEAAVSIDRYLRQKK